MKERRMSKRWVYSIETQLIVQIEQNANERTNERTNEQQRSNCTAKMRVVGFLTCRNA